MFDTYSAAESSIRVVAERRRRSMQEIKETRAEWQQLKSHSGGNTLGYKICANVSIARPLPFFLSTLLLAWLQSILEDNGLHAIAKYRDEAIHF